jgi:hypothetical protein
LTAFASTDFLISGHFARKLTRPPGAPWSSVLSNIRVINALSEELTVILSNRSAAKGVEGPAAAFASVSSVNSDVTGGWPTLS